MSRERGASRWGRRTRASVRAAFGDATRSRRPFSSLDSLGPVCRGSAFPGRLLILPALLVAVACAPAARAGDEPAPARPNVPILYEGFLPGNQSEELSGSFDVEFLLYLTPTGGRPVWSEKHTVAVEKGRIEVELGKQRSIPWSITVANFKYVTMRYAGESGSGAAAGEVLPRMPVVNVVFVAPEAAADLAQGKSYGPVRAELAADGAGVRIGSALLERSPRPGATWEQAFQTAIREKKRLPSYLEWYAAAEAGKGSALTDFADQYEWTLPWVYDTASHGRLNLYFRGRFQGCDFMDMDPRLNRYAYRLVEDRPEPVGGR